VRIIHNISPTNIKFVKNAYAFYDAKMAHWQASLVCPVAFPSKKRNSLTLLNAKKFN